MERSRELLRGNSRLFCCSCLGLVFFIPVTFTFYQGSGKAFCLEKIETFYFTDVV